MIGKDRNGRFQAIEGHGETERSFRSKLNTGFLQGEQYSSTYPRWTVAPIRGQQRYPGHPPFLTYGTDSDIDPGDSEQLFLPGFLPGFFCCYGFAGSEEFTA